MTVIRIYDKKTETQVAQYTLSGAGVQNPCDYLGNGYVLMGDAANMRLIHIGKGAAHTVRTIGFQTQLDGVGILETTPAGFDDEGLLLRQKSHLIAHLYPAR